MNKYFSLSSRLITSGSPTSVFPADLSNFQLPVVQDLCNIPMLFGIYLYMVLRDIKFRYPSILAPFAGIWKEKATTETGARSS